jgi:light-regulated signal transduction histidine kinase (bacteriophytochrome)
VVHSGAGAAATVDLTNCDREPIHVATFDAYGARIAAPALR